MQLTLCQWTLTPASLPTRSIQKRSCMPNTCRIRIYKSSPHLCFRLRANPEEYICSAYLCRCCCRPVLGQYKTSSLYKTLSSFSYFAILYPPQCRPETDRRPQKSCQHLLQWAVLAACYVAPLRLWESCEQQEVLAPLHTCVACHNRIK